MPPPLIVSLCSGYGGLDMAAAEVPGITRADALRILGNGVIPPQGAAAGRELARRALT